MHIEVTYGWSQYVAHAFCIIIVMVSLLGYI
jgi:hypothetical protein